MVIHPREADLVAGTHGRSIYIMNIAPLRALTREVLASPAHLFAVEPATLLDVDITRNKGASGARRFAAANPYSELVSESDRSELAPPGATIYYFRFSCRFGGSDLCWRAWPMDAAAIVENAGNSGRERRLGKGCEHVQTWSGVFHNRLENASRFPRAPTGPS